MKDLVTFSLFILLFCTCSDSLAVYGRSAATTSRTAPPIVYTIAGSDSGGGAGIQADLHAIQSFGCHGCSAVTCLTAQNSVGVTSVHAPPPDFLRAQLETLLEDLPPQAIKIGMLGTKELAIEVGAFLKKLKALDRKVWVVLDPVMITTSGHRLIEEDAQEAMVKHVFPHIDVLTPNKFEAEALLNRTLETISDVEEGAKDLIALGAPSVLIKGGHTLYEGGKASNHIAYAQDYFLSSVQRNTGEPRLCDGDLGVWLRSPRYETEHTHGTGCTLSASLAASLALGEQERQKPDGKRRGATSAIDTVDACCLAKAYVTAGIFHGIQLGQGPGPVAQTGFPSSHQYFPMVVADAAEDHQRFPRMKAYDDKTTYDDNRPTLGRILPVVNDEVWVQRLCQDPGVHDIQLRVKGIDDNKKILEIIKKCQKLCQASGKRLWVNDYWQEAIESGCFGVHVGQEDLYTCIRAGGLQLLREKGMAFGISTHSYGELATALGVKPSYISLGPVFATSSKTVQFDPQGLSLVRKWRELIQKEVPLVVIGGFSDAERAKAVRGLGANCVAVIGAVTQANDTVEAVSQMNEAMR